MANVQRVLHDYIPPRAYPVKGSVAAIEVGDLLFWNNIFQGTSSQDTVQPASAGSTGSSAADGRYQFANLFVGMAKQRHDLNSFDKSVLVSVDAEVEFVIANSTGVATVANADVDPGTKVGVAVTGAFVPIDDLVQIDGLHSVTVADNEAIGRVSRQVKNGDRTVRVHIKGLHVFSQSGI